MFAFLFAFSLSNNEEKIYTRENERRPIRIFFDNGNLTEEGFETQEGNVITNSTLEKVKTVTGYVQNYMEKFLKVNRLKEEIEIYDFSKHGVPISQYETVACDLYIQVLLRNIQNPAKSRALYRDNKNMTIHGYIKLSPEYINMFEANDYSSEHREIFIELVHETLHLLGLRYSNIPYWVNPENGKPYKDIISTFPHPNYPNKIITMLQTPNAMKFAQEKFGIKHFIIEDDAHLFGVELEDFDEFRHPEGRVYFNDIMIGYSYGDSKISDVTAALLLDTGFFDVNFDLIEPLPFGDSKSLGMKEKLTKFATEPTVKSYPKHYICTLEEMNKTRNNPDFHVCSYDFKSVSTCHKPTSYKCPSEAGNYNNELYCKAKDFFNPDNSEFVGESPFFDFSPHKIPDIELPSCHSQGKKCGMVAQEKSEDGFSGMCIDAVCSKDLKSYTVNISGKTGTCTKEGMEINVGGYMIKCENPTYYCAIDSYEENFKSFFAPNSNNSTDDYSSDEVFMITIITLTTAVGVTAITVTSVGIVKKNKNEEKNEENELSRDLNEQEV